MACRDSFYGVFYRTLLDTGLRPSEAYALRWYNVDFAGGTISVHRAVTRGADGKAIIAEQKTAKSRRTVPMLGGLRNALLEHLDEQRSVNYDEVGCVFTTTSGAMLRPWTFSTGDLDRTLARGAEHEGGRALWVGVQVRPIARRGRHPAQGRLGRARPRDDPADGEHVPVRRPGRDC